MEYVDINTLKDYIARRKNELFQQVMGLSIEESRTQQLRGMHTELKRLEKQIEEHFANPGGSQ